MKTVAERALWAIAQNPQDPPQYAEKPTHPGPMPSAADYQSRAEAWSAARMFGAKETAAPLEIICDYCRDHQFIVVPEEWLVNRDDRGFATLPPMSELTDDVMDALINASPSRGYFAVPCDCHSGYRNCKPYKDEDGKEVTKMRVKKFDRIFCAVLSFHPFGDALRAARERKARALGQFVKPSNLNAPEPPDPPEHTLDLIDYAPAWNESDHIARRQAQQEEVRRRAEAEGIELTTFALPEARHELPF